MNEQELQQAFIQFLAQKTGAKNQQELEAAIQQLGEEGLKQAYAEFMQVMQQQQVQAAKFGAKLNYIKQLRGQCPDGYEVKYFRNGGTVSKGCVACKKQAEEINTPSDPIEAFKCGYKMKKKKENGGNIEMDKCGKKMKKAACGTKVEKAQRGNKVTKPEFDGYDFSQVMMDRPEVVVYPAVNKGIAINDMYTDPSGESVPRTQVIDPTTGNGYWYSNGGYGFVTNRVPGGEHTTSQTAHIYTDEAPEHIGIRQAFINSYKNRNKKKQNKN